MFSRRMIYFFCMTTMGLIALGMSLYGLVMVYRLVGNINQEFEEDLSPHQPPPGVVINVNDLKTEDRLRLNNKQYAPMDQAQVYWDEGHYQLVNFRLIARRNNREVLMERVFGFAVTEHRVYVFNKDDCAIIERSDPEVLIVNSGDENHPLYEEIGMASERELGQYYFFSGYKVYPAQE